MSWTPRDAPVAPGWLWAKWMILAAAGLLLTALLVVPTLANRAFWFLIVPLLPALFLVNAEVWRNLCPVATLSTLRDSDSTVRPLTRSAARRWTGAGIVLFLLLVPLRHVLFEASALATAMLIGAAGLGALIGGALLDRKAGFCNSICPILPIERLYGQRPLTRVANARCVPCRACTQHACFDLNPERSGLVSLGPDAKNGRWIVTPFGAFALALPGFVVGFSLAPTLNVSALGASALPTVVSPSSVAVAQQAILAAYLAPAVGAAVSWIGFAGLCSVLDVRPTRALVWTAALAVGAYYWFTPAAIVQAWTLDPSWLPAIRVSALLLVGVWMWRALIRPGETTLVPVRLDR